MQIFDRKNPRTIVGYCWPWTVRPGESLDFMVSTYADGPYDAELVRVICGDYWPAENMGKEVVVEAPFVGSYSGRHQETYPGSFAEIEPCAALNAIESFTVQCFVFPSLVLKKEEKLRPYPEVIQPLEGTGIKELEHSIDEQTIVARWDERAQRGWSLYMDREGRLSFKVGAGKDEIYKVVLPLPVLAERWFLVSAHYDSERKVIRIDAEHIDGSFSREFAWKPQTNCAELPSDFDVPQTAALRFGAVTGVPGNNSGHAAAQTLNGKLDSIRLTHGVLNAEDVHVLSGLAIPRGMAGKIIGFWDFGKGVGTTKVHDLSPNNLHGKTVNLPDRAVVGVRWDGNTEEWMVKPDHYSACYFHDDDLYDAEWASDFSYTVPGDLPSGIYAAKLKHNGFVEHIPFFVAPPMHQPSSKAAFLVPTVTYAAYANFDQHITAFWQRKVKQEDDSVKVFKQSMFSDALFGTYKDETVFLATHPGLGKGVYRRHADGADCRHASQKHPNLVTKLFGATHLAMDTFFTAWLDAAGTEVDIITDDLLHKEGLDLLKDYRVVMNGHHPEYYSEAMLDAVEAYLDQGGRWMYVGGNGYWWSTPFHPELPGVVEVRKDGAGYVPGSYWAPQELFNEFDGRGGGVWEHNHRPAQRLVGVGVQSGTYSAKTSPYCRNAESDDSRVEFIFEGVEERTIGDFGLVGGGAAGLETDAYNPHLGSPAHALVLATSTSFEKPWSWPIGGGFSEEDWSLNFEHPRADMVFFETPKGGAVFSVGSMCWAGALCHNNYNNNVAKITSNVLKRFMDDEPFEMPKLLL